VIAAVDFAPGLHGHFLELIINKYIFGIPFNGKGIFQSSGAVHAINIDAEYQETKLAERGHYSAFGYSYPTDIQKIVFIKHSPAFDIVLLTNIFYRCHPKAINASDFNVNEILAMHESVMALDGNTDVDFRRNWCTKLMDRHFAVTERRPNTNLPVLDFDFASFFDFSNFCSELKRTSKFLNATFLFDESLTHLWQEFIQRNQGWQLYLQGQNLLTKTLGGDHAPIPNDWKLHAYINYCLGKIFELYDGELHNSTSYPTTTNQLLKIITQHIKDFDSKFKLGEKL
jgi:hypothetical protein